MLTLPSSVGIVVAAEPVDLRRGFDGLAAATRSVMREEPESGHLFVFLNRRRNRIELLVWDRTGYPIVYERLEAGERARALLAHGKIDDTWEYLLAVRRRHTDARCHDAQSRPPARRVGAPCCGGASRRILSNSPTRPRSPASRFTCTA